jgi:chaperone required for assembly of F1-ATPase
MQNTTQKQTLTNVEKTFIVEFLANSVYSLTQHNVESVLEEEEYFARLVDVREVLANLQMLYSTATIHSTQFNFTIAQAAQAMLSYDTEYRDTVCEQFEFACTLELHKNYANTNANFATLLERLYNNY